MNAEPLLEFYELHRTALVEANQEGKGLEVAELQQISVYLQKGRSHGDGYPLVPVYERMVLRQALPECCRFLKNVRIIAALRPRPSGFERTTIPDAK